MSPHKDDIRVWLNKDEEPPHAVKENKPSRKRMLILAMDFNGIAFWKICPEGESVNGEKYKNFLEEFVPNWLSGKSFKRPILLQDNAKPHKSKVVKEYLKKNQIRTWNHPAYSPDIGGSKSSRNFINKNICFKNSYHYSVDTSHTF
jgi:hypothetical protein